MPPARPLLGIALMAAGMALLPVGDAIGKYLTATAPYGGAFLAWSRFVVGAALIAPAAASMGAFRGLGWDFLGRQAIRGGLVAAAITCVLNAVESTPLADVYGAFFIGPSLATIAAVILLGETARWPDWVAVALGLIGVLMVLRPSAEISPGLLWALGAGSCFGAFLVATRWAAG
ncbi:MAG: EamA family transporter, partial [Pseudomonadota bacterium]